MCRKKFVKCADCGFLCKQAWPRYAEYNAIGSKILLPQPELMEVTSGERNWFKLSSLDDYIMSPYCFVNKANFHQEQRDKKDSTEDIEYIATNPRECDKWYPYREYLGPKAHYEEYRVMLSDRLGTKLIIAAIILAAAQIIVAIILSSPDSLLRQWL